jgi:hypothetical protein
MPGQIQTMPTGMGGMGMGGMGMGGMAMGNQFGTVGAMQQHQQQAALQAQMTGMNPFRQSMLPQATGVPFLAPGGQPQQQQFLQPQATGFLQPQVTGQMAFHPHRQSTFPMMSNAGDLAAQQQLQAQAQAQVQAQLQAQQTLQVQPTGFLQPQTTGSNPFRQSMMMTGGGMNFGLGAAPMQSPPLSLSPPRSNSILAPPATQSILGTPTRSNTAPMPMVARSMTTSPKPLTAQRTGSNNPFAPAGGIPSPPPQIPKLPSMNDLAQNRLNQQYTAAMGMPVNGNGNGGIDFSQPFGQQQLHVQTQAQPQQTPATASLDPFAPTATNGKSSAMSDIASAFALDPKPAGPDFASQFGGLSLGGTAGSPTSPTGAGLHTQSTGFLQPQRTGFGGSAVKPFKPTSAFGSSLMETLPSIPEPSTNPGSWSSSVPGSTPLSGPTTAPLSSSLSAPFHTPLSGLSAPSSSSGSSGFPGLHAFATGAGAGAGAGATSPTATSLSPFPLAAQPTGFQPTSSFGQSLFANSPPPTAPAPAAATHLHPQHTIQPQHTMQPLPAQATGSNPFRASMMFGAGGAGAVPGLGAGAGAGVPGSSPFGAAPFGASPFQMQQKSTQASLLS